MPLFRILTFEHNSLNDLERVRYKLSALGHQLTPIDVIRCQPET